MKRICAVITAASLIAINTVAAAPLAPGKPAGLRRAQDRDDNTILYIVGAGAIAAGIALLASGSSNNNNTTPPTTGTSTTTGSTTTT